MERGLLPFQNLHDAAEAGDAAGIWGQLRIEGCLADGASGSRLVNERDSFGLLPLHYAAHAGSVSATRLLLLSRADPKGRFFAVNTANGTYALHLAAKVGSVGCIKLLLAAGCDIDAVDSARRTARDYAEDAGRYNAQQFLEIRGARSEEAILSDPAKTVEAALADDMC